ISVVARNYLQTQRISLTRHSTKCSVGARFIRGITGHRRWRNGLRLARGIVGGRYCGAVAVAGDLWFIAAGGRAHELDRSVGDVDVPANGKAAEYCLGHRCGRPGRPVVLAARERDVAVFFWAAAILLFARASWPRRAMLAASVIFAGVLLISPILIRNAITFHVFVPTGVGA